MPSTLNSVFPHERLYVSISSALSARPAQLINFTNSAFVSLRNCSPRVSGVNMAGISSITGGSCRVRDYRLHSDIELALTLAMSLF